MARLQKHYREKVAPALIEKFGYKSPMQVPRITKITLNMGVGEAVADKKVMDNAVADLSKLLSAPCGNQSQESDCWLQDSRRTALGLHGYIARRANVRIPGPFRDRGSAPCS